MRKKIEAYLKGEQFRELFLYVFIGGLTTVLCIAAYWAASRIMMAAFGASEVNEAMALICTVISHAIAILFAFIANKKFVFRTEGWRGKAFLHEVWTFVTARLLSLGLDMLFMAVALGALGMNDMVAKLIVQVVIIVVNYLASKFWVFRKDTTGGNSK